MMRAQPPLVWCMGGSAGDGCTIHVHILNISRTHVPFMRGSLRLSPFILYTRIKQKVGMAVQKSKQSRVAWITAYKYTHPSYICYQSVSDFIKDVIPATPVCFLLCTAIPTLFTIYFWSHDFQPLRCVEKCAINHVKHT